jgi:sialic acid synthase SpsE
MRTKIIAEIGYNHNGSMDLAKQLIREAAKLGLWAVKFQKWNIEGFPENIKNQKRNTPDRDYGETYYEHRKILELSIEQLEELRNYTEKKGLIFIVSGKDLQSIKDLMQLRLNYIKVPSQRYHDNNIFKYLFFNKIRMNFQIIVSTGMLIGPQIRKSRWIKCADILMHCISLYPAKLNQCNFAWMNLLPYNGYSSHEIKGKAIKYAVASGIKYIERHFTLNKEDKGSDHKISSDVKEMKNIIKEIKEVEEVLGDGKRNLSKEELELGKYYRSF